MKIKTSVAICIIAVICIAVIAYTDMVIRPGYLVKTMVKAPIFFLVPIIFWALNKGFSPFSLLRSNIGGLKLGLILGVSIYAAVMIFYFVAGMFVDLGGIKTSLENNLGINKDNFWGIALYVSVVNSFLEEWFFRGFIFSQLSKTSKVFGYVFSSLSFSIYHIAIMDGMFDMSILVLTLVGLFVGGCIFNYLCQKNNNIYTSWFCHSFANFAMNTIGYIIFFT